MISLSSSWGCMWVVERGGDEGIEQPFDEHIFVRGVEAYNSVCLAVTRPRQREYATNRCACGVVSLSFRPAPASSLSMPGSGGPRGRTRTARPSAPPPRGPGRSVPARTWRSTHAGRRGGIRHRMERMRVCGPLGDVCYVWVRLNELWLNRHTTHTDIDNSVTEVFGMTL